MIVTIFGIPDDDGEERARQIPRGSELKEEERAALELVVVQAGFMTLIIAMCTIFNLNNDDNVII